MSLEHHSRVVWGMIGAFYTHVRAGEGMAVLRPTVFLALLRVVWWLRRPRGDAAPSV